VLGYLFKNKTKQDTTSTLLVFITPQIIRSAEDMEQSMQGPRGARPRPPLGPVAQQRAAIFGGGECDPGRPAHRSARGPVEAALSVATLRNSIRPLP
jgi:hypothetical protein